MDTSIDRTKAREVLDLLNDHFGTEIKLKWTDRMKGAYFYATYNEIRMGPKRWRREYTLIHEFAHGLDLHRQLKALSPQWWELGRSIPWKMVNLRHSTDFYRALRDAVEVYYGDPTLYSWHTEYKTLARWALRDGLTTIDCRTTRATEVTVDLHLLKKVAEKEPEKPKKEPKMKTQTRRSIPKVELGRSQSAAGAAKALHRHLTEIARRIGCESPRIYRPSEARTEWGKYGWEVIWEGGPDEWAVKACGQGDENFLRINGLKGTDRWEVDVGWSFSLVFRGR